MKLFSGTANPALAEEVAKLLDIPVAKSEVVRFDNSEVRVRIEEDVRDESCVVMQSTSNPTDTHLMELFFFCDALRREQAKRVTVIMPYFCYARQNIQHRPGEAVSAHVVIRLLESLGVNRIITCDIHDEGSLGIFSVPVTHLSTLPMMAAEVKKYIGEDKVSADKVAVVSPDQGGIERARTFGTALFGTSSFNLVVVEKRRDQNVKHVSSAVQVFGDVKGKTAVIVDDVTTSGGTLIHAAEACMAAGAVRAVSAIAHHDLGTTAPAKIQDSKIEKLFTTNTIALTDEFKFDKLQEISIASLIADHLKN
jgi:ribose-phosphate pyrophosphokinase